MQEAEEEEAKKFFHDLESQTNLVRQALIDPKRFVQNEIDQLRYAVWMKKSQLEKQVNERSFRLLDMLNDLETRCEKNQAANKNDIQSQLEYLEKMNQSAMNKLDVWYNSLYNQQQNNRRAPPDFHSIKIESENAQRKLSEEFETLKDRLFVDELKEIKTKLDLFQDIDLDLDFRPGKKYELNSVIVGSIEMRHLLWNLCNFPDEEKFSLLYRASEHGYDSANFHSRCDDKQCTLTIVKTTCGYIFGGYTNANWNNNNNTSNTTTNNNTASQQQTFNEQPLNHLHSYVSRDQSKPNFRYDQNAFIFSLTNPENRPLRIDVSNPSEAILCHQSYGPSFGNGDILIISNSNTHNYNFSNLSSSYIQQTMSASTSSSVDKSSTKIESLLTGNRYFRVANIEVFHRLKN